MVEFADLDDFDTVGKAGSQTLEQTQTKQKCMACCGTGRRVYGYSHLVSYPCGICKGTGYVTAKRLANIERAKKAEQTRQNNVQQRRAAFLKEHRDVHAWMEQRASMGNQFASSLLEQFNERGTLSEKQIAAVRNNIANSAHRREAAKAAAPALGSEVSKMIEVFERARGNGYKRPKVRTEQFDFALAPAGGKNAGYVYVTRHDDGKYIGKISPEAKFFGFNTPESVMNDLLEVCKNPLDSAVKFGKRTGVCSCCGRELTNPESVELGIGPVCRERFFGL